MARKNGESGQTAGQRLQTLRDQIAALGKRKEELSSLERQPDTLDPAAWVEQTKTALGEAAAIDKILPSLEEQARAAELQLQLVRLEETRQAFFAAQAGIEPKLAAVIAATNSLGLVLAELEEQQRLCVALGGWCHPTYTHILRTALTGVSVIWRQQWPELMDLPRKLTHAEEIIATARFALENAESMLREVKDAQPRYVEVNPREAHNEQEVREINQLNSENYLKVQNAEVVWKGRVAAWQETVAKYKRHLAELENPARVTEEPADFVRRALRLARKDDVTLEEAAAQVKRQDAEAQRATAEL